MNNSTNLNENLYSIGLNPIFLAHVRVFQIFLPIICLYGTCVNILNIFVISRNFKKSVFLNAEEQISMAYNSLIGLGISNLWICITSLPLVYLSKIYRQRTVSYYYILHGPGLVNIGLTVNVWIVTLISIGRCLAIYKPFWWRIISKSIRTNILVFSLIIICSIWVRMPDVLFTYYGTKVTLNGTVYIVNFKISEFMLYYRIFLTLFSNIFPFLLIFSATMMIIIKMRTGTQYCNSTLPLPNRRTKHLIRLLIISMGFFMFCSFPLESLHLVMNYMIMWLERNNNMPNDLLNIHFVFNIIAQWTGFLQVLGSVVDSSVYFLASKYHRRSLRKMVIDRFKL